MTRRRVPDGARWPGMAALAALSACAPASTLPRGPAAYALVPPAADTALADYRIGPLDMIAVTTFNEPSLTFASLQVDASGNLLFPLIGSVRAGGLTAAELSHEIAARLNARYTVNAQVTVVVTASQSQFITVEGSVNEPGTYAIAGGQTTLLQAIARAKSPTRTARLGQIVVFRTIAGHRTGALFDLNAIRRGRAPDPLLRGGDVVVVGFDGVKGAYRDFLTAVPFFNIFTRF